MKNAQGNVTGIVDSNLNVIVEYSYDAWGKLIETTGSEANFIGKLNPFLYRGYYYDAETGLYYLGSRYYDPVTGRFLNADEQVGSNQDILAYNLYSYCLNNPINFKDFGGKYKVLSGNRVQLEKGDTLWAISEALTGKGTNWVFFGYNGNLSKLQIGHIFNASNLPTAGKPNSKETLYNPNGTPKQERFYGPDGKPVRDRDYNHGGEHEFPHDHLWKNGGRGPAIPVPKSTPSSSDIRVGIGIGLGTIGAGYLIYRGIRMIPSLVPPLWWTIPANVAIP